MTSYPKPTHRPKVRRPPQRSRTPIPRHRGRAKRSRVCAELRQRQRDRDMADALWRFLKHEDSPGGYRWCQLCKRCMGLGGGEAHHPISRRKLATRWDLDNAVMLHRHCHDIVQHDPACNTRLAIDVLGSDAWDRLRARSVQDPPERPADAVRRLQVLVRARGLTRLARERGLMEE